MNVFSDEHLFSILLRRSFIFFVRYCLQEFIIMKSSCFVKEKKLGEGAFGVVYRVRSKHNNKVYVIKEQHSHSSVVENEIHVLEKIRPHPNVIAYHGSWLDSGKACILMEYASRGSLDDVMKLCAGPIREPDALYLFAQIVLGVNHIHRQAIIHRDLKPANVMIHRVHNEEDNYMDIIKIGDFGISKDTGVSVAKTVVGTKIYMAPEALRGTRYSFACDIWSAGIILYEMLTNEFPFNASTPMEMMTKIQRGRVTPITSGNISNGALAIIYNMLSVNPAERPRSNHLVSHPAIAKSNRRVQDFLDDKTGINGGTSLRPRGQTTVDKIIQNVLEKVDNERRQRAMQYYDSREQLHDIFPWMRSNVRD